MAPNTALHAYVAWDLSDGHDDSEVIFARDESGATMEACEWFGYRIQELVELRKAPHQVVRVVRAPMLDRYQNEASVPQAVLDAAATALLTSGRAHTHRARPEPENEGSDPIEMPHEHDDGAGWDEPQETEW